MTARLPTQRPARSDYGPAYTNARPVKQPTRELDAAHFVQLADEVTQIGAVSPRALVRVTLAGVVAACLGVDAADVTVAVLGAGDYNVIFTATGISNIDVAMVSPNTAARNATCSISSSTVVNVQTTDLAASPTSADFTLAIY